MIYKAVKGNVQVTWNNQVQTKPLSKVLTALTVGVGAVIVASALVTAIMFGTSLFAMILQMILSGAIIGGAGYALKDKLVERYFRGAVDTTPDEGRADTPNHATPVDTEAAGEANIQATEEKSVEAGTAVESMTDVQSVPIETVPLQPDPAVEEKSPSVAEHNSATTLIDAADEADGFPSDAEAELRVEDVSLEEKKDLA